MRVNEPSHDVSAINTQFGHRNASTYRPYLGTCRLEHDVQPRCESPHWNMVWLIQLARGTTMLHPPSMYKVWRCWTVSIAFLNILSYHTFRSRCKFLLSSSKLPRLQGRLTCLLGLASAHWTSLPIHHAFRSAPSRPVPTAKVNPPSPHPFRH